MLKTVDLEHLEENINGTFLAFLRKGGVNIDNLEELTKVKHSTFEAALRFVFKSLFKPEHTQLNNMLSLLPYDDLTVLDRLIDIYNDLCMMCDKTNGVQGFSAMTGYGYRTLNKWLVDETNPERMQITKRLAETRKHLFRNSLSDDRMGRIVLANNDKELGLEYERRRTPEISKTAVFILPGEQARAGLPGQGLPEISKAD